MYLENEDIIEQPLETVYKLVRDDLQSIVPFLPNVEKIEVVKKKRVNKNELKLTNHWYPSIKVPLLLKKFLKPELFAWKDHAHWHDDKHFVKYDLEGFLAKNMYTCSGTNYFKAKGKNKTILKVTFDLEIHPDNVPGIPRPMVKKALPVIEGLITKALEPNLTSLAKGLKKYFKEINK